jgi:hypothetical protein
VDLREEERVIRSQTLASLRDYALIAAVPASKAQFSLDDMKLTIKGSGTIPRVPLLSVEENLKIFLDRIRPMVANVLEKESEQVLLVLFELPELNKQKSGSAYEAIVRYQEESFEWTYPPVAILKPCKCPVDGKIMSPGWKYCPWHGNAVDPGSGNESGE